MKPLPRRTLLKGAGGIALALPLLEAMTARGQAAAVPKRFVACVNFDGTRYQDWLPSGTESSFTLSTILKGTDKHPLAPYQSKLLVLDGVDNEVSYHGPAPQGHAGGTSALLSGAYTQAGNIYCGGGGCCGWGGGITIDQHIGRTVGKNDPFPALTLAVQPKDVSVQSHISYTGPAQPVPSLSSPVDVFKKLFSGFAGSGTPTGGPDPLEPLRAQRKSVLDAVLESLNGLSARVGAADRQKLDQHATAVREIERQLTTPPPSLPAGSTSCAKPPEPGAMDYEASANFEKSSELMIQLLTMALACNLTRSVTLQWGRSVGGLTFPWLGITQGQHDLSHAGDSDMAAQGKITQINQWFAGQFAYLLERMSAIQENGGSLLDHSVVLWGNSLSKGNVHARRSVPFVIAGSATDSVTGKKYFRTGRFLRYGGVSHSGMLVSLLNAVDVPVTTFGEPEWCKGPLPNLT